jgi:eukaryotic-like serine/threonine-protein kinase
MSPEQITGKELDARTDLFSFGTVLYEMATRKVPFQSETQTATLAHILERPYEPALHLNPSLSPELDRIINKVLEKNRDVRYQYAAEMRDTWRG